MKNGIKKSTMRVALCSVMAALSLAIMLITTLVPIGTFAAPCFAGILLTAIVIEYGVKWAFGVFFVVALLSAFLAGDKEAVIYFIAIFGYYPILKSVIEKHIKKRPVQYALKLLIFNAAVICAFFATTWLLAVPEEGYTLFGVYMPLVFLAVGNVFFVLYDFTVTSLVAWYVIKGRNKIFK